jgi:hypothetical protein
VNKLGFGLARCRLAYSDFMHQTKALSTIEEYNGKWSLAMLEVEIELQNQSASYDPWTEPVGFKDIAPLPKNE